MSRVAPPQNTAARLRGELEDWISAQPPLCPHSMRILGVYRAALARVNGRDFAERPGSASEADSPPAPPAQGEGPQDVARRSHGSSTHDDSPNASSDSTGTTQRARAVPRLREMDGLDAAELSRLHGRLIALGLLAEEVVSRKTGIAYRLTREGISRLHRPDDVAQN